MLNLELSVGCGLSKPSAICFPEVKWGWWSGSSDGVPAYQPLIPFFKPHYHQKKKKKKKKILQFPKVKWSNSTVISANSSLKETLIKGSFFLFMSCLGLRSFSQKTALSNFWSCLYQFIQTSLALWGESHDLCPPGAQTCPEEGLALLAWLYVAFKTCWLIEWWLKNARF
jgi:hypothetical protein